MRTFFGLNSEYQEVIYQQFFHLKYYGGFSLFESYNLPIQLRKWFYEKLADQLKAESDQINKANRK